MSHKNEIKRKQQLQTQLQLSFANLNSTIDSWISKNPTSATNSTPLVAVSNKNSSSSIDFESLPVIQQGQGLSFGGDDDDDFDDNRDNIGNSTVKISDFTKPISKSGANQTQFNKNFKNNKRQDNDSDMLRALRNKLRDENRTEFNNNINTGSGTGSNGISKSKYKKTNGNRNNGSNSNIQVQIQHLVKANSDTTTNIIPNSHESDSEDDDEVFLRKTNSKKVSNNKKTKSKRPF